ncbi:MULTISPECIES: hypothetical protein [unclassified Pseudomonas]|uniref:hypothetical protein n=1 Tax=unclassified Pseudomonas TaxID=196821 RepID=UPI00117A8BF0|nr:MULTISPECIES: hypothetical protein [unclassified Pseudomonas]
MTYLNENISRLMGEGSYYAAFILKADAIDIRLLCKSYRHKCRAFTGGTDYKLVWVRVNDGLLLMVGGAPVFSALLQSFLNAGSFAESQLYLGPNRGLFEKRVGVALRGYSKISGRSYGGSR